MVESTNQTEKSPLFREQLGNKRGGAFKLRKSSQDSALDQYVEDLKKKISELDTSGSGLVTKDALANLIPDFEHAVTIDALKSNTDGLF